MPALCLASSWNTTSGSWSVSGNWAGGVPNATGATAVFGNATGTSHIVSVDANFTVTSLSFTNTLTSAGTYTIAGAGGELILSGPSGATLNISASSLSPDVLAAPLDIASPLTVVSKSQSLTIQSNLSGSAPILFRGSNAETILSGDNSNYTGQITVGSAGFVEATTTTALGSGTNPVIVTDQGQLRLTAPSAEPLLVQNGLVVLMPTSSANYSGGITLNNGTIAVTQTASAAVTLTGGFDQMTDSGTFAGSIGGTGELALSGDPDGPLHFTGTVNHTGPLDLNDWPVAFSGTMNFNGPLQLEPGALDLQRSNTVDSVRFLGGELDAENGAVLTSRSSTLDLQSGICNGAIAGIATINKTTIGAATVSTLGNFTGQVNVNEGFLGISGSNAFGTGTLSVNSPKQAAIVIGPNTVTSNSIYLNNASGYAYDGALTGAGTTGIVADTVTGAIDLGNDHAFIGGELQSNLMVLSGPITGGGLYKTGTYTVQITSPQPSYTGVTRILGGNLDLINGGRLSTTSQIILDNNATLTLDNSGTDSTDRIADSIPITLNGGTVSLLGHVQGGSTETIGTVTLNSGESGLFCQSILQTHDSSTLTITQLNRVPGATMQITGLSPGGPDRIIATNAPALNDGIVGGWAMAGTSPLTYGASGFYPLQTFQLNLNAAAPTDNVGIASGSTTLNSDKTINFLGFAGSGTLDLGGHTLRVDSGGVAGSNFETDIPYFINGTLTSGASSPGEMFFSDGVISATIADSQPATALSIVKSSSQELDLSGTNTYSGATYVNKGNLTLLSSAAIPSTSAVDVRGGASLTLNYQTGPALTIPSLHVSEGAMVQSAGPRINAGSILLEDGTIGAQLTGSGTLIKSGENVGTLGSTNLTYSGQVNVNQGILVAGMSAVPTVTSPLGTGTVTINPTGRLAVYSTQISNPIVLNGGELAPESGGTLSGVGSLPYSIFLNGATTVTADSTVLAMLGAEPKPYTGNLTFVGPVTINPGVTLTKTGPGSIEFLGSVNAEGNFAVAPGEPGNILFNPSAGSSVSGHGIPGASITIKNGGILSPGDSPGTFNADAGTFASGGIYKFEMNDAIGSAGQNWDLATFNDSLTIAANSLSPFSIQIYGLGADNNLGKVPDFNPAQNYSWLIASAAQLTGFSATDFSVNSVFFNINNPNTGIFSVSNSSGNIYLNYTPTPEPSSLCILALAQAALCSRKRRAKSPQR